MQFALLKNENNKIRGNSITKWDWWEDNETYQIFFEHDNRIAETGSELNGIGGIDIYNWWIWTIHFAIVGVSKL